MLCFGLPLNEPLKDMKYSFNERNSQFKFQEPVLAAEGFLKFIARYSYGRQLGSASMRKKIFI